MRVTVRWMWLLVVAALLYTGVIFYRRWNERRQVANQALAEEAERARKIVSQYGGGKLKILQFYVTGTRLCYGVANAKSVRIEPGVEAIPPSLSRCVESRIQPGTTYVLTATDANGGTQTQSVTAPR